MRALGTTIAAPPFPRSLPWVNVARLHMHQQRGRPVLLEFWDFCRVNSLRTLPYLKAWHARYADAGLRIVGVHTGAFVPSRSEENVRRGRRAPRDPVAGGDRHGPRDLGHLRQRGLARALPVGPGADRCTSLHYGEGAYEETEREIQALLGIEREPVAPLRPEDRPGALLAPQTPDQPGAYCGPYAAGAAWAVVDGAGELTVNGRALAVREPGCIPLAEHPRHTAGTLELRPGPGVTVLRHLLHAGLAA